MQTAMVDHKKPWWIRYKLYHIPFWIVYHYVWWVVLIGSPLDVLNSLFDAPYAFKYSFYVVFQALGVYFNLYYLIPKFLEKGRYVPYILLVLITIVVCAACIVPGYYASSLISGRSIQELYGVTPNSYFYFFQTNTLASSAASMTLGMSVKLTKNWAQSKRREQLLEKEKLETELKLLKYQFNPHFLFNTINSIFVLIHKNPDMASASLAKFSELLRHQLYESNEKTMPLCSEINYLENFIELEKLRQSNQTEIEVNIQKQFAENFAIAPFVLMTFVENAFKHVSRLADTGNWIHIGLTIQEQELHFIISNSVSTLPVVQAVKYSGIGLQNVKRRLDLVYPNKHKLAIEMDEDYFKVTLLLQLEAFVHHGTGEELLAGKHFITA